APHTSRGVMDRYGRTGFRRGGERGGLAVGEPLRPGPAGEEQVRWSAADRAAGVGDDYLQEEGSLKRMDWTLAFIGFTTYIAVITTYELAIGDVAVVTALLGLLFLKQPVRFPALLAV